MKKLGLLAILGAFLCSFTILAACGPVLSAPTDLKIDLDALTLTWVKVQNADKYIVEINGDEQEDPIEGNVFKLDFLAPDDYEFRVKAISEDRSFRDSAWSEKSEKFTREDDALLKYRLINSNREYEVMGWGTAKGVVTIPNTYKQKPVTSIGQYAFKSNRTMTSLIMGDNVTNIAASAFQGASALTSITFSKNLKTIGDRAFSSCTNLRSISLPDSLTSMGIYAFSQNTSLESVTFGKGLTTVSNYAFKSCSKLESLTLPENITSVGVESFRETGIRTISFSDKFQNVGNSAFQSCKELESIDLPNSVTTINSYAFWGCEKLGEVKIGTGIKLIGLYAFLNSKIWKDADKLVYVGENRKWLVGYNSNPCTYTKFVEGEGNKEVTIDGLGGVVTLEENTYGISNYAFAGAEEVTKFNINEELQIIGEAAFSSCKGITRIDIPNSVKFIGNYAFQLSEKLLDVTIGDGLTSMGGYAFYKTKLWEDAVNLVYADKWLVQSKNKTAAAYTLNDDTVGIAISAFTGHQALVSVRFDPSPLPSNLKYIGDYAFNNCITLKTFILDAQIYIPNSVKSIGVAAFNGSGIEKLNIGSGVERIEEWAFRNTLLHEVDIPDTVKYVGNYAFSNCFNLTKATVGTGITEISNRLFAGSALTSVTLEGNVTTIGDYAFAGLTLLTTIDLPDTVTTIGDYAFYKSTSLETINIPNGVTKIGRSAFYDCKALTQMDIPAGVTHIDKYTFFGCVSLQRVNMLGDIKIIDDYAFYGCEGLESITLPENLEAIGSSAFLNCVTIDRVVFPASLKSIGNYAFRGTVGLTTVLITKDLTHMGNHVFYGSSLLTVYAEYEALPAGWESYWNSSNRPVIWGCTLSANKEYVVSVTKKAGGVQNANAVPGINAPFYLEHSFKGWTLKSGSTNVDYTASGIGQAPNNVTLYAIWQ